MNTAILLYDGFTALDAIGPYEVLSRLPEMKVHFVGKNRDPKPTDTGLTTLSVSENIASMLPPDVLLIPGGSVGTIAAAQDAEILQWVRSVHATTQWTTSVCTGALILGAAGVLQGLQATTHWAAREQLANFGATYVPERFVRQGKIITAAGVSAGIDMALYLAREIAGEEAAKAIQLAIEYDPHPPFSSGSLPQASQSTIALSQQMLAQEIERERARLA